MPLSPKQATQEISPSMQLVIGSMCSRIDAELTQSYSGGGDFRIAFNENLPPRACDEVIKAYKKVGWKGSEWEKILNTVVIILREEEPKITTGRR